MSHPVLTPGTTSSNMGGSLSFPATGAPSTQATNSSGSSLFINKLKIVGSGANWAVAPCEPFYLMGIEPPAPDVALTGAKNLIEHYGLGNAYQKFCSKPLREELSAFLPHLTGNVDVPASVDGSGLMALIERPPIRGKELRPFAPGQLDPGFRLHPGPLPQEYAALFAAASPSVRNRASTAASTGQSSVDPPAGGPPGSRVPATAAPGLSGFARRRSRYEVHRGIGVTNSASSGGMATSASGHSGSFLANSVLPPTPNTQTANSSSVTTTSAAGPDASRIKSAIDLPPGLIPVPTPSSSSLLAAPQLDSSKQSSFVARPSAPPPPLLSVHQNPISQRSSYPPGTFASSDSFPTSGASSAIPGPPVLQSIHPSNISARSSNSGHHSSRPGLPPPVHFPGTELNKFSSSSSAAAVVTAASSSPSAMDWGRSRPVVVDGMDEEYRKKKRKEKKRRKEKD